MNSEIRSFKYDKTETTFKYFLSTLKDTIKGYDYFVNWAKVIENVSSIEISLNILNYLIGKENVKEEFKNLLVQYPEVISAIPVLIAARDLNFKILKPQTSGNISFDLEEYNFSLKGKLSEFSFI